MKRKHFLDIGLMLIILILVVTLIWGVIALRTEGAACLHNPIQYAQNLNPGAICTCFDARIK